MQVMSMMLISRATSVTVWGVPTQPIIHFFETKNKRAVSPNNALCFDTAIKIYYNMINGNYRKYSRKCKI